MSSSVENPFESADRDLERRVASFLAGRHFPALRLLMVKAQGGTVTLRGQVGSYYEKQLSQQCGRRVAGVIRLVDEVNVVSPPAPRARYQVQFAVLALAAALLTTGCGKADPNQLAVFPASGRVKLDGQPTPGAFLVLHPTWPDAPKGVRARAQVNADGTYTLTTYKPNDGAPAGEYAVTVEWRRLVGRGDDVQVGPNLLPPRYLSPATSKLRLRVAEGANQMPTLLLTRR